MAILRKLLCAAVAGAILWPMIGLTEDEGLPGQSAIAIAGFRAGFIRPATPYHARVSQITGDNQTTGNKRMLAVGDQLYLEVAKPEEVSPGDLYVIYRRVRKVFHPVRGDYLGDLTMVIAVIKVTKVSPDKITAKVIRNYDALNTGDGAMRLTPSPPEEPTPAGRIVPEGTGLIIELPPGQTMVGAGSIVYVDWGRQDGLQIGDRLDVFRISTGLPPQVIGELNVLALEDRTAAARIISSRAPFLRGDRVAMKEPLQQTSVGAAAQKPESVTAELDRLTQQAPGAQAALTGATLLAALDRLVDQLDYQPGDVMPLGQNNEAILKQISDLLKNVTDKRIVIEGHTDNVEIGPKLRKQFRTNQQLSNARAAAMRNYLIQQGGLDAAAMSAVGLATTKPVASNRTEDGRKKNRRIEVVLLPKPAPEAASVPIEPAPQPIQPEPTARP